MSERTIYIVQTDITGQEIYDYDVPDYITSYLAGVLTCHPNLVGCVYWDKESGNFYKASYSL